MKRLVLCFDGTWMARASYRARSGDHPTNVEKTHIAVKKSDDKGNLQITAYYRGIGTSRFGSLWCGMTGAGISQTICDAYAFVVDNFDLSQDELYLFGFSRGAYTARSLSGFMEWIGVVEKQNLCHLPEYYEQYRKPEDKRKPEMRGPQLQTISVPEQSIPIRFLGVWDTVGSLGVPIPLIGTFVNRYSLVGFHNTKLSTKVSYAFQALAVHEHRKSFSPSLWSEKTDAQVMEQSWFPGTHGDVGGGNPDQGLSDAAWMWMLCHAEARGLEFDRKYLKKAQPNSQAGIYNSSCGEWRPAPKEVRTIGKAIEECRSASFDNWMTHHKATAWGLWQKSDQKRWGKAEQAAQQLKACSDCGVTTPETSDADTMLEDATKRLTEERIARLKANRPNVTLRSKKPPHGLE